MDRKVEMIMSLIKQLGAEIELPAEFDKETSEQKIVYDWNEVMINE